MGLIKCKECGGEVSAKAASCPHCGAPVKVEKKNAGCGAALVGFFVLAVFISMLLPDDKNKADTERVKTPQELRKEEIGKCFRWWGYVCAYWYV